MTAATTAALAFFATFGYRDQRGQPSPGLLAPCLGLALVAGSALWIGLGSIVVLLAAWGTRNEASRASVHVDAMRTKGAGGQP